MSRIGSIRSRCFLAGGRLAITFLTLSIGMSACGDDGPSGPSDNFDIAGQWSWRVTDATADDASCSITGVTITFAQDNGTLTGHRVATGGGNVTCTIHGSTDTANYTTSEALDNLSLTGTTITFVFVTNNGPWEMTGNITDDNTMGGTATIRMGTSIGPLMLTGPWTATRD